MEILISGNPSFLISHRASVDRGPSRCPELRMSGNKFRLRFEDTTFSGVVITIQRRYTRERVSPELSGVRAPQPLNQANNPQKHGGPEQLRSWLVICGPDNVQDYDVADFSTIRPRCRLLRYLPASNVTILRVTQSQTKSSRANLLSIRAAYGSDRHNKVAEIN